MRKILLATNAAPTLSLGAAQAQQDPYPDYHFESPPGCTFERAQALKDYAMKDFSSPPVANRRYVVYWRFSTM
jgi:hypothetical protein